MAATASRNASAILTRTEHLADRTLGTLTVYDQAGNVHVRLATLELPDRENRRRVSRIPAGVYEVLPHDSSRFPGTYRLAQVRDRTAILIHAGNYPRHTSGCILVGAHHRDLDGDGLADTAQSRVSMQLLNGAFGRRAWTLTILDEATLAIVPPERIEYLVARAAQQITEPRLPDAPGADALANLHPLP